MTEAADEERLEELSALAYLSHVSHDERRNARGTVVFDRQRSSPGLTAFGNRSGEPEAYFFDREGRRVGSIAFHPTHGDSLLWMELTGDGQLLVSGRGYLLKSTWSGEAVWEAPRWNYHHGFAQAADGTIYAMAGARREIEVDGNPVPIVDDYVLELSPAGELKRSISMFELLGSDAISPALLAILTGGDGRFHKADLGGRLAVDHASDVFHLNSVAVVDRDLGVAHRGDLVLSLRSVIDARKRAMLELNVSLSDLDAIIDALPAMREPTVATLHGGAGMAVKAAVPRSDLPRLIPRLRQLGATDIVVSRLEQIVP